MPNPTKPTTNLTREHVVDAVADLLYSNKTARTLELAELMQLIDTYTQAKERVARIDEAKVYRKSYPKRNTRANDLSRMTRGDLDRRIGELIALKDKSQEK